MGNQSFSGLIFAGIIGSVALVAGSAFIAGFLDGFGIAAEDLSEYSILSDINQTMLPVSSSIQNETTGSSEEYMKMTSSYSGVKVFLKMPKYISNLVMNLARKVNLPIYARAGILIGISALVILLAIGLFLRFKV